MKKDKILLCIDDLNDVEYFKELGVTNFLFPLKDYSIGYNTFSCDEIKKIDGNAYILANRLLTDDDIDNFLNIEIPKNIKGFVVEDIGLYEVLKDKGYELINFQNHLNNNYKTINYWLKYFDSLVISTDITREEIETIVSNAIKPLVLNTFGLPMIMYSRRNLVSNYYRHLDQALKKEINIEEKISNSHFFLKESEYGTAVFNNYPFDYRSIIGDLEEPKIRYYLINSAYIDKNVIKRVIMQEKIENSTNGFLDRKTIYRIGDAK